MFCGSCYRKFFGPKGYGFGGGAGTLSMDDGKGYKVKSHFLCALFNFGSFVIFGLLSSHFWLLHGQLQSILLILKTRILIHDFAFFSR